MTWEQLLAAVGRVPFLGPFHAQTTTPSPQIRLPVLPITTPIYTGYTSLDQTFAASKVDQASNHANDDRSIALYHGATGGDRHCPDQNACGQVRRSDCCRAAVWRAMASTQLDVPPHSYHYITSHHITSHHITSHHIT